MRDNLIAACWMPGLPHLLTPQKSNSWSDLHRACEALGTHVRELKPDVLVVYSTQWVSVLGTSFQAQPNPKGVHVDDNWYELGDLAFDFKVDASLSRRFCEKVRQQGLPTKLIDFEHFPIDTGSIVALRFLNPKGLIPVCLVSSWIYSSKEQSFQIGKILAEALTSENKRAVFVASSLLSTRYFTKEIDPRDDKISDRADDQWNQKLLGAFETADFDKAALLSQTDKNIPVDMQLNALHWLHGALNGLNLSSQVHAYGSLWGTGAAVVEWRNNNA